MAEEITSLEVLDSFADNVVKELESHPDHATLLTLSGDLGVGKTAFTKALARSLGVNEHVTSPTFVLAKKYPLTNQKFSTLIHIDAYRLEGEENLKTIGFSDMVSDPKNLIVLEWPERVSEEIPDFAQNFSFEIGAGDIRIITYGST